MSSFHPLSYIVIILLIANVNLYAPYQLNLHLTQWSINNNGDDFVLQHDCLFVSHWKNEDDIHEMTPYCLSEWPSKWNIQQNTLDQKYSFAQLFAHNITSEHLYLWSAPLDIVENYQLYLNQLLIFNETSLEEMEFLNCTGQSFGPKCQYSFDLNNSSSSSSSLSEMINEHYLRDPEKQLGSTCYVHLECDLGSSSLCIQWHDICDGVVRCINGTDEEHCWQLEINECNENEFRCQNGQCIPRSFFGNNNKTYECLDGTDELIIRARYDIQDIIGPPYKLEGMFCGKTYQHRREARIECQYECLDFEESTNASKDWLFFVNEPKTLSSDCWSALSWYLKIIKPFYHSNCTNICQGNSCREIIDRECPEMFFLPNAPIAFGHIYFAYTKAYLINRTQMSNVPEYICYNEQLCGGFHTNKTSILFNNTICRRPKDFSAGSPTNFNGGNSLCSQIDWVRTYLSNCNTVPSVPSIICDNATMYQCVNSSKCIPQIRLRDTIFDCDHKDDEELLTLPTKRDCPIKSSQLSINCMKGSKCVSRKVFADGRCNCRPVMYGGCEDELFPDTHPALHISFPHICNHILQFGPILIDGKEQSDESECEQWPCHNVYTHCNGILDCSDGIDELDCHPPLLINCSSRSFVCLSHLTTDYTCLSAEKINDGNIDCIGAVDEAERCQKFPAKSYFGRFFCDSSTGPICILHSMLCDTYHACLNDIDETFCGQLKNPNIFMVNGICDNEDASTRSDIEEFLCNQFKQFTGEKAVYFSLGRITKADRPEIIHTSKMASISVSKNEMISLDQHHCHSDPSTRVWLNKDTKNMTMSCLCPPSHYGNRCQYQNERVSLTIQFRAFSDSWQTPFIIIVSLIDDTDQRTIHSHQQLTYIPVPNCKTKYNIELLYATRPKNQSQLYFVHLDIYEKKKILSYRGSLHLSLPFMFLPIQRVAVQLDIPYTGYDIHNCSNSSCGDHGRCVRYFDDSKDRWFCQCDERWSGRYCHLPHNCSCSSGSMCLANLANNRSLCVCPIDKWGPRCLLENRACRSNGICKNGGQCIPAHSYMALDDEFICICQKGYSGRECQVSPNTIKLSFEPDMPLPQSMLIHLIETKRSSQAENGTIFKMIPVDRSPALINIPRSFHIAFVEFVHRKYYLILVKDINNQSKSSETTLRSSNHCPNLTDIVNETLLEVHLIRRMKFYHRLCQDHSSQLSCFYDIGFLCLCYDFYSQRQANCFEFDHKLKRNCRGRSQCQHDAECLQDDANCPASSICICPRCFYGPLCQFTSSGFGLSLDAILGNHIQPHVSIQHQPVIVQVSLTFTVIIISMGLFNCILLLITFNNNELRETGCSLYLIGSSMTTLLISLSFGLKFSILLIAQMTYMNNKSFLLFQCRSLDFVIRTGLSMDQWLIACVAMERAVTVIKGVNFDRKKYKTIAKFLILVLLLFTAATNIQEITSRQLLEDESNDEKRIWCIVKYPEGVQFYHSVINIIHFCAPFIINVLSAVIIIIVTARLKTAAKTQTNYQTVLYEQIQQHKKLLIGPIVLVILAIPRLLISFLPGCMKSSDDAWLFLIGYFISFIPPILHFLIFVMPSKTYKQGFNQSIKRYQHSIRTCFRFSQ